MLNLKKKRENQNSKTNKRNLLEKKAKNEIALTLLIGLSLIAFEFLSTLTKDDVTIYSSEGKFYVIRPEAEDNKDVSLIAKVSDTEGELRGSVNVTIDPYRKEEKNEETKNKDESTVSKTEQMEYELNSIEKKINENTDKKKVMLPTKLETGENVIWEINKSNNTMGIMAIMIVIIVLIYRNRYSILEKEEQENKESVVRQLPEFVNKLVLLLNAGLVLNSAMEKTIEESMSFITEKQKNDFFIKGLSTIDRTVKTTNGSVCGEFRKFAKKSGVKELMRISNIISDNIDKGVELTGKLQNESEYLWVSRKRTCEEKGRLAETKLTLPLMIFLMVLIVITVAPALLEL